MDKDTHLVSAEDLNLLLPLVPLLADDRVALARGLQRLTVQANLRDERPVDLVRERPAPLTSRVLCAERLIFLCFLVEQVEDLSRRGEKTQGQPSRASRVRP